MADDKIRKKIREEVVKGIAAFKDDDEFDPMEYSQALGRDAHIFDLFDNLAGDGWILKLSKESAAGTLRFLMAVEQNIFENWGDIEIELQKIVKMKTSEEIDMYGRVRSWGSGPYRIQLGNRNKVRGESARVMRRAVVIDIDAQEPPSALKAGAATSLADIAAANALPADQLSNAVLKGIELATNKEAKAETTNNSMMTIMMNQMNESNKMFLGLITAIMSKDGGGGIEKTLSLMNTMGVMNKPKSLTEQIAELKAIGIPITGNESAGDIDKIAGTIEKIMTVAKLVGGGEGSGEASLTTEIIRRLPLDKIPDMLESISRMALAKSAQPQPQTVVVPRPSVIIEQNSEAANKEKEVQQLLDYLYQAVNSQDASQFPIITDSLSMYLGGKEAVFSKVRGGMVTDEILVASISKMDARYTGEMLTKLQSYAHAYVEWVKNPAVNQEQAQPLIPATCNVCGTEYDDFTKERYEQIKAKNNGRVPCAEESCKGEIVLNEVNHG
jgi:hypothetical protein